MPKCDRFWLLTWTTYGNWLPGDRRGFVSSVKEGTGTQIRHNIPGTAYDADQPGLTVSATRNMKHPAVLLTGQNATIVGNQIQETANYRDWQLLAVSVMANHVHLVVGVPNDPEPDTLLRDFKSYASRALNRNGPTDQTRRWWTESGSKRKLPDEPAVIAAIRYVQRQQQMLYHWSVPDNEIIA